MATFDQNTASKNKGAPTHEQIARRAYQIWEAAGRPDGLDGEHWRQAERELMDASPENAPAAGSFSGVESSQASDSIAERAAIGGLRSDRPNVPSSEGKAVRRKKSGDTSSGDRAAAR